MVFIYEPWLEVGYEDEQSCSLQLPMWLVTFGFVTWCQGRYKKTHQPKTRGFFNSYCGVPWGTDMYQCIFPYVYNIVYIYIYIITYIMFHMKATWSVFPYSFSIFILHFPTKTCHFWGARTWPGDQVSVGGEGIRAWICCGFQRKTRENYDLPCLAIIFTGNLGKQGNVTSRFCSENQGNGWFCCRNHLF